MAQDKGGTLSSFRRDCCAEGYLGGHSINILPNKGFVDLCFTVLQSPTETIINQICLLSWVTPQEAREYQKKIEDQLQSQLMSEKEEVEIS